MNTRRDFLQQLAAGAVSPLAIPGPDAPLAGESELLTQVGSTSSHVGSLYPFIQSQAVKGEFPLSYLNAGFRDYRAWKRKARAKFLELLHYSPPKTPPNPEILERVDRGDYFLERVAFNTTPDVRVPAYVLIPKYAKFPAPGIVALHDHGGFYLWGKEKLVDLPGEHPVVTEFKSRYYAGRSIATDLVKQGYVVAVIDMFYWGERRLILENDPADWRDRPKDITPQRINAYNGRSSENEQLVARNIYSDGFTWSGAMFWDDVRTVDYLIRRPDVDKHRT